jgi:CheY-like chemotaxis protein
LPDEAGSEDKLKNIAAEEVGRSNSPSVRPAPLPRARVLVIDDEPAVGRTIQRLLSSLHDVTVVTNGKLALELFDQGQVYDVILCDLTMPELSGMDVYAQVVMAHRELAPRFVFMTGGTFTPRSHDFIAGVPNQHIDKPFDLETMRSLVRARLK